MNLWEETIEKLERNGKTFNDVNIVCGKHFQITKENFRDIAQKTEYYAGYGFQEVAFDLKLIGDDFVMVRLDRYGYEWWSFISLSEYPKEIKTISKLADNNNGSKLEDINELWEK